MGLIRDEDFLSLWREHGKELPWRGYAHRLSVLVDEEVTESYVRVWVQRNRERLQEQYGVTVGARRVRADREFEAWPDLPRQERNQSLYRLLEYHARVRALGLDNLAVSVREMYVTAVRNIRDDNQIIRYDPHQGLYRDTRTPDEAAADPDYERISEPKSSYVARQQQKVVSD
ncbi:hypothetical protein E1264_18195 [Actinomadura sp. KC216]|uniref:hypothetical protein n=1 Tax=Actinomadura sp. KC216 TaxID=2530370 RepID=UPI0010511D74|nr:hypothetical protein [Actinomadura sp. KC216]TDB86366.1 hypothetical protein E1264_18195 [Actinomadura sp. KC216]